MKRLVDAAEYDAWYQTPLRAWIGETEFRRQMAVGRKRRSEANLGVPKPPKKRGVTRNAGGNARGKG